MPGVWSPTWKADLSKVLLIGKGPLPHRSQERCSFPQLRTRHFKQALESTGVDLRVLVLQAQVAPLPECSEWSGVHAVQEEGPNWLEVASELSREADILVSAGPYNPGRLACLVAGDRPVWVDIPGDPLAEHQALRLAEPEVNIERRAAARAAILPVLCRADALSTISERQRLATLGQLHLLGRRDIECMVPIHNIPIAFDFPFPQQLPVTGEGVRVALVGAFNTWLDHVTLVEGLQDALYARPDLSLCIIGGPVGGLHARGYQEFTAWAKNSVYSDRIHLHGWLPQHQLSPVLQHCHAGLWLDRGGDEPLLGSRTRALLYAWMGMQVIGSPTTELAEELAGAGHLNVIPPGDAGALSRALQELQPEPAASARERQAWLMDRFQVEPISTPLQTWVLNPERQLSKETPEAVLAADHARLRSELSAMRATTTWRLLSAAHRALGGRNPS